MWGGYQCVERLNVWAIYHCVEGAAYGEYAGYGTQQQEGVVVGLGHVRHPHTLDDQLHAELVLLQNVCTRTGFMKN